MGDRIRLGIVEPLHEVAHNRPFSTTSYRNIDNVALLDREDDRLGYVA